MRTSIPLPRGKSNEEIRAEQELKSQRDFVYETHQSIQRLNEGILALSAKHDRTVAESASDRKDLLIEFENLREWILSSFSEMGRRLGDAEKKLFEVLDSFTDLKEEIEVSHLSKEEFENLYNELESNLISKHLRQTLRTDGLIQNLAQLKDQAKQDLENLKKELTPIAPEVDPIKAQLDERFKILKVDFDGLIKEINLLKKAVAYDKKKFENVYTLIERLKEGKK